MHTMTEPLPPGAPGKWLPDDMSRISTGSIKIELVGVAEAAEELGVPRINISMWDRRRRNSGFPYPLARLASGPVYDMNEIRAWWADRQGKKDQA